MLCPHCQNELRMSDRQGVEIDYCPKCRGIWLDRGELDKLLEFARLQEAPREDRDDEDYSARRSTPHRGDQPPPRRKRESFWSDVFDFD